MIAPTLNGQQKNYERNMSMTTESKNTLAVIDGETLMDMRLPPTKFCVDTLLPQGVTILGGAPKIGKSWLVLDLCIRVAKGEPLAVRIGGTGRGLREPPQQRTAAAGDFFLLCR